MRQLVSVPDIQAPDAEYPAGRIQNDDPDLEIVGTPLIEELYGDLVQFIHKLIRIAGLTYNDLPENETSGFQLLEALEYYIRSRAASQTERGSIEIATNAEVQGLADTLRAVPPAGIASLIATVAQHDALTVVNRFCVPGRLPKSSDVQLGLIKQSQQTFIDGGNDVDPGNSPLCVPPSQMKRVLGGLQFKTLQIGSWNMDSTSLVTISHGIGNYNNVRFVNAVIINDSQNQNTEFVGEASSGGGGFINISSTQISLTRLTGGMFDNSSYDGTGFNRGWITIGFIV